MCNNKNDIDRCHSANRNNNSYVKTFEKTKTHSSEDENGVL